VARRRLDSSGKKLDRFEREDQAFFERVRNAYLSRARAEPARMRVIDAAADLAHIRRQLQQALEFA
jgi:dTMP kinase